MTVRRLEKSKMADIYSLLLLALYLRFALVRHTSLLKRYVTSCGLLLGLRAFA